MTERDREPVTAIHRAFPAFLKAHVEAVVAALPEAAGAPSDGFTVNVGDELIVIPYRVYIPESPPFDASLSTVETLIAACIYSRHHDGFVRQRQLRSLLIAHDDWVVPFVLQLAGEYVVEILQMLDSHTQSLSGDQYRQFTSSNPLFIERTKARIVSYWNCYYRSEYPNFKDYPGYRIGEALGWWNSSAGKL